MKLYFNGCSHTWGDDLSNPDSQAWPAVIANKLGCDFLNDAVSGGTNDRIMYQTIKHAHEFDKFYIAWTYTSRFTRYRADNNHEVNFNPQLTHKMYGDRLEYKHYGKLHYSIWHNELYCFKMWLQNIILLQRYFESINKPYVMINADHNHINQWSIGWNMFNNSVKSLLCFDIMDDDTLYKEHTEIQKLLNQIDTKNYVGWGDWWLTQVCKLYPVGITGHLLSEGHKHIADYIINDTNS
jgi:hypothetical protein